MRMARHFERTKEMLYAGCAGWNVPPDSADLAADGGQDRMVGESVIADGLETAKEKRKSHLKRYAAFFPAVEINSSFYRPHLPGTYAKWREAVPPGFRFSVKFPSAITHDLRLKKCNGEIRKFLEEVGNLQETLGCLLIQLPPSLRFDATTADEFLTMVRDGSGASLALEPRHPSWFEPEVFHLLERGGVSLVHADPRPAGVITSRLPHTAPMAYFRLHGSPETYHSSYDQPWLEKLLLDLIHQSRQGGPVWCIFDNTARGAAFPNALTISAMWRHALGKNAAI